MPIRVALHHTTSYAYDKRITLGPQTVRLRPAPHTRTPVRAYSMRVEPRGHFVNWHQDPYGNYQARLDFQEKAELFKVEVDLVAEMTVINPFDFFLDDYAEHSPFEYEAELARDLRPYLETKPIGPKFEKLLKRVDRTHRRTVDFLVDLNRLVHNEVGYVIRMEPGVQAPEETLEKGTGSCRDSGWLIVQMLRRLGFAARFVSGYLIQLKPDVPSLDGPSGPTEDFTDLHAWAEVFVPGAGWMGLDPTSGLFAGEGHIPLAATPSPGAAAPITGAHEPAEVDFSFSMAVTRVHEDPRVTLPYTDAQVARIHEIGDRVDAVLSANDVRLTMGGEPTFVSIDDMEGAEWTTEAMGPMKQGLADNLIRRLRDRWAPGGLLHFGQGKWYPGESLPRWALTCYWRRDGQPIWKDPGLVSAEGRNDGVGVAEAERFVGLLTEVIGVSEDHVVAAYEDAFHYMWKERRLPINVSANDPRLEDPEERARMTAVFERGLTTPKGFVLPVRKAWFTDGSRQWVTGPWPVRPERMQLVPGDSPIGLRLPLEGLPWTEPAARRRVITRDPFDDRGSLPDIDELEVAAETQRMLVGAAAAVHAGVGQNGHAEPYEGYVGGPGFAGGPFSAGDVVRTALCVEPRDGRLYVFMPPVEWVEDYLELVAAIEQTADALSMPVMIEGYEPPHDPRVNQLKVTPDPGVIEVNVHPASSWSELVDITTALYEDAHYCRLGTEKFDIDGRHTGTGGGNHIVLGGPSAPDSPFLRRPDLLKSLVTYWNNHPSLSYLFSGRFIGPTSQAPRVDEGRRDAIAELRIAMSLVPQPGGSCAPWLVDRIFRNLLVDLTGNTHRAEFCIDKLYPPETASLRRGLLEFRAFEMPPHAMMSLTQQLLIRAMVARFWVEPYGVEPIDWSTSLHDRFLLPRFVWDDFVDVIEELEPHGIDLEWFKPHFEFRFPFIGSITQRGVEVELRDAIEPWYVLGEEPAGGATARYVDSSVERLQVTVRGMTDTRHAVSCNGRKLPLHPTGVEGEYVAGVRYRAWQPPSCLHPTIPVHSPLVFDVVDTWRDRSIGGCTYHVSHPGGRAFDTFPVNASEAESRRAARFRATGHTPGPMRPPLDEENPAFPMTLDLRRPVQPV